MNDRDIHYCIKALLPYHGLRCREFFKILSERKTLAAQYIVVAVF